MDIVGYICVVDGSSSKKRIASCSVDEVHACSYDYLVFNACYFVIFIVKME